jgi:hypothetical protein
VGTATPSATNPGGSSAVVLACGASSQAAESAGTSGSRKSAIRRIASMATQTAMGTGRRGSGADDDRAHFVTDHVHYESSHGTPATPSAAVPLADEPATCYHGPRRTWRSGLRR